MFGACGPTVSRGRGTYTWPIVVPRDKLVGGFKHFDTCFFLPLFGDMIQFD